jgi:chromosome segregation ATPase
MSKYDSINTAAELAAELRANGLSTVQEDIDRAGAIFQGATVEELAAVCIGPERELKEAKQQIERLESIVAEWEISAEEQETEIDRCKELSAALEEARKKLAVEVKAHDVTRWKLETARARALVAEYSRDELLIGGRQNAAEAQLILLKAVLYDHMKDRDTPSQF